jgi:hypothetical protein
MELIVIEEYVLNLLEIHLEIHFFHAVPLVLQRLHGCPPLQLGPFSHLVFCAYHETALLGPLPLKLIEKNLVQIHLLLRNLLLRRLIHQLLPHPQ